MTLDEVRLMAGVNARAQCLFENGYRARWKGPRLLAVRNSQGAVYDVDTQAQTCNCPFFTKSVHPCKHVLGWRKLLTRQRTCRLWLTLALLRAWNSLDDAPSRTRNSINQRSINQSPNMHRALSPALPRDTLLAEEYCRPACRRN